MTAPLTPERLAEVRAHNDRLLPNIDLQCPVEVADESGHLEPCGKVSSTWRWYDGDDHEPMLMACCYGHETNGAEELATVLADDVPDLLAALDAATERAKKEHWWAECIRRRDGDCICDRNPETTEGPDECCPWHGRGYAQWIERGDVLQERAERAEAALARVREVADGTPCMACQIECQDCDVLDDLREALGGKP